MGTCLERIDFVREARGLMGHFGARKTLDVLHEIFFWPKMKHDVERVCELCFRLA